MSLDANIIVSFECNSLSQIAPLAESHLESIAHLDDFRSSVGWYAVSPLLSDMIRRGKSQDPTVPGLYTWGYAEDYFAWEGFHGLLSDFWVKLLGSNLSDGPRDFGAIVIIFQNSTFMKANIYEVRLRHDFRTCNDDSGLAEAMRLFREKGSSPLDVKQYPNPPIDW